MTSLTTTLIWVVCTVHLAGSNVPSCDFEKPCEFLQLDSRWGITSGQFPPNSYGPVTDHTVKTGNGGYVYIASYASTDGQIRSPVYNLTSEDRCLEFYYLMNAPSMSSKVGSLKVWLSMGEGDTVKQYWFDASTNTGTLWNRAFIQLPRGRYRFTIEAHLIDYRKDRIIAIDDITLHKCRGQGGSGVPAKLLSCDFEDYTGCPELVRVDGDEFTWQRTVARNGGGMYRLPSTDHTLGVEAGHYKYSHTTAIKEGTGKLLIQRIDIPYRQPFCLDFYYKFSAEGSSAKFYVYDLRDSHLAVLWSSDMAFLFSDEDWTWAAIELKAGTATLAFELRSYDFSWLQQEAMFVIDDVTIAECDLLKGLGMAAVQTTPKKEKAVYATSFHCSFDSGDTCGATREQMYSFRWDLEPSATSNLTAHQAGYLLLFNSTRVVSSQNRRPMASLMLPHLWAFERLCLTFHYLMSGPRGRTGGVELEVRINGNVSPHTKKQLWVQRLEDSTGRWERAMVELPYTDFQTYLRAKCSRRPPAGLVIALDNVLVDTCSHFQLKGMWPSPRVTHTPEPQQQQQPLSEMEPATSKTTVSTAMTSRSLPPLGLIPVTSRPGGKDQQETRDVHRYEGRSGEVRAREGDICSCNCTDCGQPSARCGASTRTHQTLLIHLLIIITVFISSH